MLVAFVYIKDDTRNRNIVRKCPFASGMVLCFLIFLYRIGCYCCWRSLVLVVIVAAAAAAAAAVLVGLVLLVLCFVCVFVDNSMCMFFLPITRNRIANFSMDRSTRTFWLRL